MSELGRMRERLIEGWSGIADHPPAVEVDGLVERSLGLVHMIGWIDTHPESAMAEYRAEIQRYKAGR